MSPTKGITTIEIHRYAERQANVNSYLLSDPKNVIVVSLLSNSSGAEEPADSFRSHGQETGRHLRHSFILISKLVFRHASKVRAV
jgi:hypothetical protein